MEGLTLRNQTFTWGDRTYVMGILNVTPDSFSDGGQFNSVASAVAQAEKMVAAGIDILDIGGQSTRPGSAQISLTEELDRTIPVIRAIREKFQTVISIDTTRAAVAQKAIATGADIVNDISGATFDDQMLTVVRDLNVPIILMHIRGTPETMQSLTDYQDLIADLKNFFQERIDAALALGIPKNHLILDPGIGFAKTALQNYDLIRQLQDFRDLGYPLLVGPSRKSFIGHILNKPDPTQRVWGTAAACAGAIAFGADILRVHDGPEMIDVAKIADVIWRPRGNAES
ncbi:dihydropteroate synthase [Picosynechococcus sp. PCC 7003]|uniref:dihydropteroate synthase n=1 Tax=Picosynechococcus sp. PCC 7003 TaxID=374981 RepID=UPI000810CCD5|nr:dihydropteroate synthase [Picosynechococcus sp. PCC 7003]ANV84005.1 dihydropteroate synthase [Picosynechococcus sp. PCC 7003]